MLALPRWGHLNEPLVQVRNLEKLFPVRGGVLQRTKGWVKAVTGVSFDIAKGETLGLVGESGCGKSTLGRMLVRLLDPTGGSILFENVDIATASGNELKTLRRDVQMIFQDPYSSLDPRTQVGSSIAEGLKIHGIGDNDEVQERVSEMLELVGLERHHASRFPHEFSGGQRQRIGIARALVLRPRFVVADEPVSALDVSVQAQVLNLLSELQQELDLTLLFIAHNLAVVEHVSDRVAVMYLGDIVEIAHRDDLYREPQHPHTEALLSAIPIPDPRSHVEARSRRAGGRRPQPAQSADRLQVPSAAQLLTWAYATSKRRIWSTWPKTRFTRRLVICGLVRIAISIRPAPTPDEPARRVPCSVSEPAGYLKFASIGPLSRDVQAEIADAYSAVAEPTGTVAPPMVDRWMVARDAMGRLRGVPAERCTGTHNTSVGLFRTASRSGDFRNLRCRSWMRSKGSARCASRWDQPMSSSQADRSGCDRDGGAASMRCPSALKTDSSQPSPVATAWKGSSTPRFRRRTRLCQMPTDSTKARLRSLEGMRSALRSRSSRWRASKRSSERCSTGLESSNLLFAALAPISSRRGAASQSGRGSSVSASQALTRDVAAHLHNRGLIVSERAGWLRAAPHASTSRDTVPMLADAVAESARSMP